MSIRWRAVGAMLRKDLRILWPICVLAGLLLALRVVVDNVDLGPGGFSVNLRAVLPPVAWLTCSIVIISVIQLDTAVSARHEWLTRPIGRLELLVAKGVFIAGTVLAPVVAARIVVYLALGYAPWAAFLAALEIDTGTVLFGLPVVIAIGTVTATLLQAAVAFLVLFVVGVLLPSFMPEMGIPLIDESMLLVGYFWIVALPARLLACGCLVAILLYVYRSRDLLLARVVLASAPIAVLVLRAVLNSDQISAVQRVFSKESPPAEFGLMRAGACFASESLAGLTPGPEIAAHSRFAGRNLWTTDQLEAAGSDAIAFASSLTTRGVPDSWRLEITDVTATWVDGAGATLESIHATRGAAAPLATPVGDLVSAHYWLLPRTSAERIAATSTARLRMQYSLTLFAPRSTPLAIDGRWRELPGFGYCRASNEPASGRVNVLCFKWGVQPAAMRARFAGALRGADAGLPDFAPAWFSPLTGRSHRATLTVPKGVDRSRIELTAYEARSHFEREIESAGTLGGPTERCPLPSITPDPPLGPPAIWRDDSPHESLRVNVDDGVQLEVLDWGGTGRPLVLLAGLTTSAHIYDEIAPKLARDFHVVGISRRGHGGSTHAEAGYDVPRLAEDVLRVMDQLKLRSPLLVGHSLANVELSELGARHGERIAGLIYLDGAQDMSQRDGSNSELNALSGKLPPPPDAPRDAFRSYENVVSYSLSLGGVRFPQGEYIASNEFAPDGSMGGRRLDPLVPDAIEDHIPPPDYASIRIPAVSLYPAARDTDDVMRPWYDRNDPALRATVYRIQEIIAERRAAAADGFRNGVRASRVVNVPGAKHLLFISDEATVIDEILRFAAAHPVPAAAVQSAR